MKVLILANNDVGLYKFRKELIETLLENYQVFISLPYGDWIPNLEKIGCIFIETKISRRGKNPMSDIALLLRYINEINKVCPDIVLTYTIKPNIYGGMACQLENKPYITNITGIGTAMENDGFLAKLTKILYRIGLKRSKTVFFQNKANLELFLTSRITCGNLQLIPGSGVNLETNNFEEYPPENGEIRFLFVGRIMKDKGIEELIACAEQVHTHYTNVHFDIVGNFDEEVYRKPVAELHNKGILTYFGHQNDVHLYMKRSHAIVLPSYHEGLSNVLLEAAACGRPILASNIPGCYETYVDGVTGIGFTARSSDALTEAVEKFIRLPYEQKAAMGAAGRKKAEAEFNRKIVIQAYIKEIEKYAKSR